MIILLGANGGIAKRYKAILNYLGQEWRGFDVLDDIQTVHQAVQKSDGIIIATPTDTHTNLIAEYSVKGKPILCEKPISKNIDEVRQIEDFCRSHQVPLQMVYQYQYLVKPRSIGESIYDFYEHGKDGLIWDCIQIVGLSRREPELRERSPHWFCKINGHTLNKADMDPAYTHMVGLWIRNPKDNLGMMLEAHEKTAEMERRWQTLPA